ncbi:MAG: radical SAM protein [Gallionellaceae bacterium]|nr:radical SAM protein [Gallionellaceae bacterium]
MSNEQSELNVSEHRRDIAGLRYVYPVISRRAGGVSVGINLNTNNACNWRCCYCQVPDLKIGTAPPVDLALLETELRGFLHELLHGDFMQQRVPAEARRINDIAISGNGEPTSAAEFLQVIDLIEKCLNPLSFVSPLKLVLITNGSLLQREYVQQGLRKMAKLDGEVWFKLDRASEQGMQTVNDTRASLNSVRENLRMAITCCPNTWLQTCWFALDGSPPSVQDEDDYLKFLSDMIATKISPQGVLLYGIARTSMQPEAPRLSALPLVDLERFAKRIRALGVLVKVSE